jgi:anti-sigma B factor antagonist
MMKVKVRKIGDVSVLDLNGKITIGSGDIILREAVQRAFDEGAKKILLNLDGVSYMDSAGIGELVACHKRAVEKNGHLKLLRPSGKVRDLLALTKIDEIFESYGDEKEALVSF